MAEDIIDEVVADVEELFPPKPGGIIDRHRQRKAAQEAAARERENEAETIEGRAVKAVKVAPESPEVISAITYTIAAGGTAMVLPASPYRHRATISVVTPMGAVTLGKDSGAALGGVGYQLAWTSYPAGSPTAYFPPAPLVTYTRAQLWALNTTSSPVQVSVLAEIYAPEESVMPAAHRVA